MAEGDTRIELSRILMIALMIILFALLFWGLYRYLNGMWGFV